MSTRTVYMTAGSLDEARRIAADLVEKRLAACVNMVEGMRSVYRWEGRVVEEQEVLMFAKTRADLVDALTARVKELHSYDVPCVVALTIEQGNADFVQWIHAETIVVRSGDS